MVLCSAASRLIKGIINWKSPESACHSRLEVAVHRLGLADKAPPAADQADTCHDQHPQGCSAGDQVDHQAKHDGPDDKIGKIQPDAPGGRCTQVSLLT